jgi:hypothetical protein
MKGLDFNKTLNKKNILNIFFLKKIIEGYIRGFDTEFRLEFQSILSSYYF